MTATLRAFTLLFSLALATAAAADELTLYFYPSANGLDFSTPRSLAQSAVANELVRDAHSIGHVNVELRCEPTAEAPARYLLAGMTNADAGEARRLLVSERYGLGILFHTFAGKLYSAAEIKRELTRRYESGKLSFVTFKINAATCARLADYAAEFDARELDTLYGLPHRPRHGEGAGCSAYAASFLELAGLLDDGILTREWTRFLRVPTQYVGGPLTGASVSLRPLLISFRSTRWAEAHEAHFPIHFWDPELMHSWTLRAARGRAPMPALPASRTARGRATGLVLDAEAVPTPTEPIWKD